MIYDRGDQTTPGRRRHLALVIIAAFSVLATINAYWFAHQFPDEIEYWTLAKNLVRTGALSFDGETVSAYRPPLVAWILTPIVASGASLSVARMLFVAFFAASGVLTASFLHRIFPRHSVIPVVGSAFVLCNPVYFFSAGNLYPQQVLTPFFLTALLCVCSKPASSSGVLVRAGLIGICTAASLLASAPSLFSLVPIWVILALEDFRAVRQRAFLKASRLVVAGSTAVLLLSPYIYRNCHNVHPGIYISLNSGINLLLGNSPQITPYSGVNVDLSGDQERLIGESEFDWNQRLTQAAIRNVREDPGHYGKLYLEKLLAGFSNTVVTVTHGYNKFGSVLFQIYMVLVWIGVALLIVSRSKRTAVSGASYVPDWEILDLLTLLVLTAYMLNLAGYAVFFNRLRFRIPVDVALALVSTAGWAAALFDRTQLLRGKRHPF